MTTVFSAIKTVAKGRSANGVPFSYSSANMHVGTAVSDASSEFTGSMSSQTTGGGDAVSVNVPAGAGIGNGQNVILTAVHLPKN